MRIPFQCGVRWIPLFHCPFFGKGIYPYLRPTFSVKGEGIYYVYVEAESILISLIYKLHFHFLLGEV